MVIWWVDELKEIKQFIEEAMQSPMVHIGRDAVQREMLPVIPGYVIHRLQTIIDKYDVRGFGSTGK